MVTYGLLNMPSGIDGRLIQSSMVCSCYTLLDTPELLRSFLQGECIRVFDALCDTEGGGVDIGVYEQISGLVELLQMSVIEVIG
jgi:hypothetical protein